MCWNQPADKRGVTALCRGCAGDARLNNGRGYFYTCVRSVVMYRYHYRSDQISGRHRRREHRDKWHGEKISAAFAAATTNFRWSLKESDETE